MSLHYLIDGYNLIKRSPMFASKKLEDGRQALVSLIERNRPHGSLRNRVTVVFDGKPGMYGLPASGEARVVFTEYETADDLIKRSVEEAGNKKEIVVVTDDKQLLLYVRALGAGVMAVNDFLAKAVKQAHGVKSSTKPSEKAKVISAGFEHVVNVEFERIWLQKKTKEKK